MQLVSHKLVYKFQLVPEVKPPL